MINYKLLRQDIKSLLDQKTVAEILSFTFQYEIDKNFKFRLREYEQTPSASIAPNGNIKDFGNGWSGDVVSVLHKFHNISLSEATKYIAELIGIDVNDSKYRL